MATSTPDSAARAADTVIRLLWKEGLGTKRGPKPKLTVEQVTDAGIAIADEEGLDAVTMQRVADRLGSTKMGLYRYVSGKGDLTALMLDRALGPPAEAAGADWRATLASWASDIYQGFLGRPWLVELVQRPHPPGPCELLWFEVGLSAMAGLPLTGGEKLDVLALLVGHVAAMVRQGVESPSPEADLAAIMARILSTRAETYPHTAAAFAQAAEDGMEEAFTFGIERALDGVEVLVAGRSRDAGRPGSAPARPDAQASRGHGQR